MVTVEVTAEDIARGVPQNLISCPIALALLRATGRDWIVYETFVEDEGDTKLPLPGPAVGFISDFDAGRPVRPFAFEVEL